MIFYKNHKFIYWLSRINNKETDKFHDMTRLSRDTGDIMENYLKKKIWTRKSSEFFYEIGKSDLWKTNI